MMQSIGVYLTLVVFEVSAVQNEVPSFLRAAPQGTPMQNNGKDEWPFRGHRKADKMSEPAAADAIEEEHVQMCEADVAAGKPATADGTRTDASDDFGPWNAVDGRLFTRWQSTEESIDAWGSHWIELDLMHPTELNRVDVKWEQGYFPDTWYVQGRYTDKNDWQTLTSAGPVNTTQTGAAVLAKQKGRQYRYVRVLCEGFQNTDGCSIGELRVFTSFPCAALAAAGIKAVDPEILQGSMPDPNNAQEIKHTDNLENPTSTYCPRCELSGEPQAAFEKLSGKSHNGDYLILEDLKRGLSIHARYGGTGSAMSRVVVSGDFFAGGMLVVTAKKEAAFWKDAIGAPMARPPAGVTAFFQEDEHVPTAGRLTVDLPGRLRLVVDQLGDYMNVQISWQTNCIHTSDPSSVATHGWRATLADASKTTRVYTSITLPQPQITGYCGTDATSLGALSQQESLLSKPGAV